MRKFILILSSFMLAFSLAIFPLSYYSASAELNYSPYSFSYQIPFTLTDTLSGKVVYSTTVQFQALLATTSSFGYDYLVSYRVFLPDSVYLAGQVYDFDYNGATDSPSPSGVQFSFSSNYFDKSNPSSTLSRYWDFTYGGGAAAHGARLQFLFGDSVNNPNSVYAVYVFFNQTSDDVLPNPQFGSDFSPVGSYPYNITTSDFSSGGGQSIMPYILTALFNKNPLSAEYLPSGVFGTVTFTSDQAQFNDLQMSVDRTNDLLEEQNGVLSDIQDGIIQGNETLGDINDKLDQAVNGTVDSDFGSGDIGDINDSVNDALGNVSDDFGTASDSVSSVFGDLQAHSGDALTLLSTVSSTIFTYLTFHISGVPVFIGLYIMLIPFALGLFSLILRLLRRK